MKNLAITLQIVAKVMKGYALFIVFWIFISVLIDGHKTISGTEFVKYQNILLNYLPIYKSFKTYGLFILVPLLFTNTTIFFVLKNKKKNTKEFKKALIISVSAILILLFSYAIAGFLLDLTNVGKLITMDLQ